MKKREGYLLVEILISLFIFSVLVFVVSVFLKRVVIVEKAKKDNQKMYEKMYFSMDKIVLDIKNRDIQGFSYEGENNNIFVKENRIVFKLDQIFYKLEYNKGKLYISDAENLRKFGSRVEVGKFREAKFEKVGDLLIIRLNEEKNESVRAIRI
ncbi:prepilin-type N-terminal cleavage/methylation domain-containing protein [Leptotrichia sp. oral taxon 223]|uniref:prepilin-type N-terminal cleavage/methylation domain-containing protein n=1 Tax=Leptotrichia sp. oral taxon 223 TaxID=712363 RepID=UPI0015BF45BF|nr:prepilin-type N-terminal cleavage/methylation domain-containing protein [Leptotrichia sp. oral taxon 223]NWO19779.1 prepilin-type N-terminal cleavage/methylation domain-containing protein [Leptotrichia sp. oral taxon 223]